MVRGGAGIVQREAVMTRPFCDPRHRPRPPLAPYSTWMPFRGSPMPTRRILLTLAPALLAAACAETRGAGEAARRAAHRGVTFVYVGADDCPPCLTWRKTELPKFEASPLRRDVDFHAIFAARWSYVADPYYWPAELAWLRADAELKRGAPQFVVARDGKVLLRSFGTASWNSQVQPLLLKLAA